jgi:hypothetical protein
VQRPVWRRGQLRELGATRHRRSAEDGKACTAARLTEGHDDAGDDEGGDNSSPAPMPATKPTAAFASSPIFGRWLWMNAGRSVYAADQVA